MGDTGSRDNSHAADMYKGIFVVAGIIAAVAFVYALREVFAAATVALVLFYMLDPIANFCEGKRLPGGITVSRVWASLVAIVVGAAVISLFFVMIIPPVVDQVEKLVRHMPLYLERADDLVRQFQHRFQRLKLPPQVERGLIDGIDKVAAESSGLLRHAASGLGSFFDQAVLLIMIPFVTFYLMIEKSSVRHAIAGVFPRRVQAEVNMILSQSSAALKGYITGQLVLSVIMGVCMTITFMVMGLNAPLLLGIIAGATKMLPVIGNLIGCIPAVLVALSISTELAVVIIIIFSVLQLLENKVILPVMMSHYVHVSPLTIICALMVGEQVGGVLGMFVSTPLVAVMRVVYTHLRARYD